VCVFFITFIVHTLFFFWVGLSIYTSYFLFLSFTLVPPPKKKKVSLWSKSFHIYIFLFISSLIGKLRLKLIREEVLFEIDHIDHYPFFMIYNNFGKKTIKASIIGLLLT